MSVEPVQIGVLVFAGFLYWGHREYVTGFGGKHREVRERHGLLYMLFLARSGRALLPGAWAMGGFFFATVVGGLYRDHDSEAARVVALVLAVLSFGLLIYALTQFVKPRRNAKVPDWVRELEEPIP